MRTLTFATSFTSASAIRINICAFRIDACPFTIFECTTMGLCCSYNVASSLPLTFQVAWSIVAVHCCNNGKTNVLYWTRPRSSTKRRLHDITAQQNTRVGWRDPVLGQHRNSTEFSENWIKLNLGKSTAFIRKHMFIYIHAYTHILCHTNKNVVIPHSWEDALPSPRCGQANSDRIKLLKGTAYADKPSPRKIWFPLSTWFHLSSWSTHPFPPTAEWMRSTCVASAALYVCILISLRYEMSKSEYFPSSIKKYWCSWGLRK